MSSIPFNLTTLANGVSVVTAYRADADEPFMHANESHPNFEGIVAALRAGDPAVWDMFDFHNGVAARFRQVTERVSWDGNQVFFDDEPIHSVLADQLHRALEDGNPDNYTALAKFWEKLALNPTDHSRNQAYDWLASHRFQITADGDVVGFKGVRQLGEGMYESSWASQVSGKPSAFVNGVPVPELSRVPQKPGDTVTMPRDEVVANPSVACERGLHVATRSYAGSYGTVLEVHVNPRDIVSVPTGGRGEKVRVCRYTVAGLASSGERTSPVLRATTPTLTWVPDVGYRGW